MRYRTFGRTGLRVSTVSMGANRLGDPGSGPEVWPPLVEGNIADANTAEALIDRGAAC